MNYAEVLLNNIASLALIPIVIAIVLKLKNAQIDSLREQNNILKEQAKLLGLFRVSEVEKQFKALKKFYERQEKEADKAKTELDKATKELENVKSLDKKEAELIVRLFKTAFHYISVPPPGMVWSAHIDPMAGALYSLKGPIGDAWRESWDGGKMSRDIKEYERKKKERERESSSSA